MALHGKSDLNVLSLSGEVTREPFYSNNGTAVLSATLKVEEVRSDGQTFANYFVLKFWRDDADTFRPLIHQGEYVTALNMKAGVNKRESNGETYFDLTATYDKFSSKILIGGNDAGLTSRPMDMESGLPLDADENLEQATMPRMTKPKPTIARPVTKPAIARPATKPGVTAPAVAVAETKAPVNETKAPAIGARPTWAPKAVAKPVAKPVVEEAVTATVDEYNEDLPF